MKNEKTYADQKRIMGKSNEVKNTAYLGIAFVMVTLLWPPQATAKWEQCKLVTCKVKTYYASSKMERVVGTESMCLRRKSKGSKSSYFKETVIKHKDVCPKIKELKISPPCEFLSKGCATGIPKSR